MTSDVNRPYVTVVSVGGVNGDTSSSHEDAVSPLLIHTGEGAGRSDGEDITIYRLPGEKLGLGLKFEGGSTMTGIIQRLYIQSINKDSPVTKIRCSWGVLREGDEILKIQNVAVNRLSPLDCVNLLKDSSLAIRLKVRTSHTSEIKKPVAKQRLSLTPTRKSLMGSNAVSISFVDPPEADSHGDGDHGRREIGCHGAQSSHWVRRELPGWEGFSPPTANIYTDLIAEEERALSVRAGSESDETGSSVSTVIEMMSHQQGLASLSRNSSFSDRSRNLSRAHSFSDSCSLKSNCLSRTQSFSESSRRPSLSDSGHIPAAEAVKNKNMDLALVLSPFEQLERELDDGDDIIEAPPAFDGSQLEPISEYSSLVSGDDERVTVSGMEQPKEDKVSTKLFVSGSKPPQAPHKKTEVSYEHQNDVRLVTESHKHTSPRLLGVRTKKYPFGDVNESSQPRECDEDVNRFIEDRSAEEGSWSSDQRDEQLDDVLSAKGEETVDVTDSYQDDVSPPEVSQRRRLVKVLSAVPKMESPKIQTLVDNFENQKNTSLLQKRFASQDFLSKSDAGYGSSIVVLRNDKEMGKSQNSLFASPHREKSCTSPSVTSPPPVYYGSVQNVSTFRASDAEITGALHPKPRFEDLRKSNLNSLLQNRKKSLSKLKGLVIPDVQSITNGEQPRIVDLPEIKTYYQSMKLSPTPSPITKSQGDMETLRVGLCDSRGHKEGADRRLSVEQRYKNTAEYVTRQKYPSQGGRPPFDKDIYPRGPNHEDESDGDSAVSSIGSGSGYSPPSSPADLPRKGKTFLDLNKSADTSDEDARLMLVSSSSSSSSSCSGKAPLIRQNAIEPHRTRQPHPHPSLNSRAQSIDNINRVNVIGASRHSSGLVRPEGACPEGNTNLTKKYRSESELGQRPGVRRYSQEPVIRLCTVTDVVDGDPGVGPQTPVRAARSPSAKLSTALSLDTLQPAREASTRSLVSAERWNELERKYSSSSCLLNSQNAKPRPPTSPDTHSGGIHDNMKSCPIKSRTNFKALAQKWEKISSESSSVPSPTPSPTGVTSRFTRSLSATTQRPRTILDYQDHPNSVYERPRSLPFGPGRFSLSSSHTEEDFPCSFTPLAVDKSDLCGSDPLAGSFDDTLLPSLGYKGLGSNTSSTDDLLEAFSEKDLDGNNQYSNTSDNRETFERNLLNMTRHMEFENGRREFLSHPTNCSTNYHIRMSSQDSSTSEDSSIPTAGLYGSVSSLRDQFGSVTSLASSTSLISTQELQQLIDDANQSLEESGTPSHEIIVVVLHRENTMGGIGITLAGGSDYETKEITVHKVINGSVADRDGRILRGDRVLSINGKSLKGVTHKEALTILKSPRPEVVLVISRSRSVTPQDANEDFLPTIINCKSPILSQVPQRPPKILESPLDSKSLSSESAMPTTPRGPPMTLVLKKEGAGLGFSLEGGKDSPLGDRPLTVKKIFSGGVADKHGILKIGDELIAINSTDLTQLARIEAWNYMKKLPDGSVTLVIRKTLEEPVNN